MLQELNGNFNSIKKTQASMKFALREIKKNIWETNSDGKETRLKSMVWSRRKKETFSLKRMKKKEF